MQSAHRKKWPMSHARRSIIFVLAGVSLALARPQTAAAQFFPYARPGRRFAAVMGGPIGPAPLDPYSVARFWGFLPSPLVARQSIGHEIIWTGPNGYVYRPVYPDQDPSGADQSDGFEVLPKAPAQRQADAAPARAAPPAAELLPANPKGLFDRALLLFRLGRYDEALGRLDQLLLRDSDDGQAELLSAQALFALGEYDAAVASLDRATQLLPEEEWDRYVADYREYFPSALRYAVHLRSLERFVDQAPPEQTASRLLLAYHYGCLGYADQAFARLDQLKPSELSRRLSRYFDRQRESADNELPAPAPAADMDGQDKVEGQGARKEAVRSGPREF